MHRPINSHADSAAIKGPAQFLSLGVNCKTWQKATMKPEFWPQKSSEMVDMRSVHLAHDLTLTLGLVLSLLPSTSPQSMGLIPPNPGQTAPWPRLGPLPTEEYGHNHYSKANLEISILWGNRIKVCSSSCECWLHAQRFDQIGFVVWPDTHLGKAVRADVSITVFCSINSLSLGKGDIVQYKVGCL